jgi:hypothetical protein
MKNLIKNRAFQIGFCLSILAFLYLNLFSYINRYELVRLEITGPSWGYPLYLVTADGMWNSEIEIFGILFNLIFWLVCSFIIGLTFKLIWSKLSANKLR